jgi:hypothetical protein
MNKEPYENKLLNPIIENKVSKEHLSVIELTKRHAYDLEQRIAMLKKVDPDNEQIVILEQKLEAERRFVKR